MDGERRLRLLCNSKNSWVADCLRKKDVFTFDKITVIDGIFRLNPDGTLGRKRREQQYALEGMTNREGIWGRADTADEKAASTLFHERRMTESIHRGYLLREQISKKES